MNAALKYRPEVDGLRTIAVFGVILFHYNPEWLRGGFLGVDVFFVISGYLLTAIINRELHQDRFAFKRFWMRRLRRLYPALVTMVIIVTLLANYIQIGQVRADLPLQALAAVFSFSNILLWKTTSGYWGADTGSMTMLHTWSLSLEEHFYLFLPVFLYVVYRYWRKWLYPALWGCTLLSFALCLYGSIYHREATFFWLPTRAWELMMGSLLAIKIPDGYRPGEKTAWQGWATLAGLGLIFLSFFLIGEETYFPSAYPLPACLGTVAILAFGRNAGFVRRFLACPPMRYVGMISYSLYLWHWPIILFSWYFPRLENPFLLLAILFAVSLLSYLLVEVPCRRQSKRTLIYLGASVVPLTYALLAIALVPRNPYLPPEMEHFEERASYDGGYLYDFMKRLQEGEVGVLYGNTTVKPEIMLVGSSHALAYSKLLIDYTEEHGQCFMLSTGSSLEVTDPPEEETAISGTHGFAHDYSSVNLHRLSYVEDIHPHVVLVCGRWDRALEKAADFGPRIEEVVSHYATHSDWVIILEQVPKVDLPGPYGENIRKYLLARCRAGERLVLKPDARAIEANIILRQSVAKIDLDNVLLLDPSGLLTNSQGDVVPIQSDYLMYFDDDHLNVLGGKLVFESVILPRLQDVLPSERTGELFEQKVTSAY